MQDSVILSLLAQAGDVAYAGVTGSSAAGRTSTDVDVVAVVEGQREPTLSHGRCRVSVLSFDRSWLSYCRHLEDPVGLIPSVLYKSILLSQPIIGWRQSLNIPQVRVCEADWINLRIKKCRYRADRRRYIKALLLEAVLTRSPTLEMYHFDNVRLARELGLHEIADELEQAYNTLRQ